MYRSLVKGKEYRIFVDGLMYVTVYKYRYFNKILNKWHYCFTNGIGHDWTIETERVDFFYI